MEKMSKRQPLLSLFNRRAALASGNTHLDCNRSKKSLPILAQAQEPEQWRVVKDRQGALTALIEGTGGAAPSRAFN